MRAMDWIAEQRIQEALRKGEFDNLPGAGQALVWEDDLLVPAEVRSVYRVLKNAGFVPPEIEVRRAAHDLRAALPLLNPASQQYLRALQKLHYLDLQLAERRGAGLRAESGYAAQLMRKFGAE